ncbi:MAG: prepilin peptidase, partial [Armatimonadetes bacterium]|nr:prepilin peptidase [Armatimonadota bacterium]
ILNVFLFAFGAALGSFLNVVIYRLPRAESFVHPPSHCFSCGARLGVVDLFPVLSYLFLRGRCRHCGARFSPRYALVEAACGLLAIAVVAAHGFSLLALALFVVCLCLVAVLFIDLDHMIIPDEFVAIIAVLGLATDAWRLAVGQGRLLEFADPMTVGTPDVMRVVLLPSSLVGLLVGAGLLYFLGWVFEKIMGKPSMGGGDVKLAGAMGTWLGPGVLFLSYFLIAVIAGALIGVVAMALRARGRRDYIPFGPMLAASGIAVLLWGDTIAPWVIGRFTG